MMSDRVTHCTVKSQSLLVLGRIVLSDPSVRTCWVGPLCPTSSRPFEDRRRADVDRLVPDFMALGLAGKGKKSSRKHNPGLRKVEDETEQRRGSQEVGPLPPDGWLPLDLGLKPTLAVSTGCDFMKALSYGWFWGHHRHHHAWRPALRVLLLPGKHHLAQPQISLQW